MIPQVTFKIALNYVDFLFSGSTCHLLLINHYFAQDFEPSFSLKFGGKFFLTRQALPILRRRER